MKKLAATFAALLTAGTITAAHAAPYGMAGCGLGSVLLSSDGFIQIFAATTNGTSASQTFGITTGTSNCIRSGVVLADKEQEAFFEANFTELKRDVASGGGEYLSALTQLFSCEESASARVNEQAQKNYETVFPSESTTPRQALYVLKLQLSLDEEIAGACIL